MFLGTSGIPGAQGLTGEPGRPGRDGLTGKSGPPGQKVCICLQILVFHLTVLTIWYILH